MNNLKNLLPIVLMLIFACNNKEQDIKEVKFWKYSDGANFGDILNFESQDFSIKNDTIFKLGTPLYGIEQHKKRSLSSDQVLKIKDLRTGKTARYVSK